MSARFFEIDRIGSVGFVAITLFCVNGVVPEEGRLRFLALTAARSQRKEPIPALSLGFLPIQRTLRPI